ncbi:mitochondrial carrier [Tuber magnatum]|uniref:Mitochondrial carrier n=1 Tax=Tuber magnatum TaxID=42249 RepID=A0A317SEL1_9PEZI|nr:mitochondrial carrier [Tuber magnatum]
MSSAQSDNVLHAIAGAGGGVLSMVLTYPLITLSTRSQVESKRAHSTILDATRRIIQREGISGLYAGLNSAVFGISVTNFVYYYWYEWSRTAFERAALRAGRSRAKLTTLEAMAAGALAGSATVLITNPIWVVNTRMTARKRAAAPSSPGDWPVLCGGNSRQLKNVLERRKKRSVTPQDAFFLGALGKLVATALTYPYITVKSRMHVAGKGEKKHSVYESLRNIVQEEGWTGLYGGIGPKLVQSVLTAAFLFAFKDALYVFTATALANRRAAAKLKAV